MDGDAWCYTNQEEEETRPQTYLSIHVGTVHVDLATILMDDVADLINAFLVHSMGGGVCHHECCQPAGVAANRRASTY